MLCSWEGNVRSSVEVAVHNRLIVAVFMLMVGFVFSCLG